MNPKTDFQHIQMNVKPKISVGTMYGSPEGTCQFFQ